MSRFLQSVFQILSNDKNETTSNCIIMQVFSFFSSLHYRARRYGWYRVGIVISFLVSLSTCSTLSSEQTTQQDQTEIILHKPIRDVRGFDEVIRNAKRSKPESPTVKVGMLLPLSGRYAALGQTLRDIASQALFDHRAENLILRFGDTGGHPQGVFEATRTLLDEGVHLILGPLFFSEANAIKSMVSQARVPMLTFSNDIRLRDETTYVLGLSPVPQIERLISYIISQDAEGTSEEVATSEETATSEEVATSEETTTSEEVATSEETTTSEEVATSEETTTSEEVATSEETTTSEEVATSEETTTSEEVATSEETTTSEEVATSEETATSEEVVTSEETATSEEVATSEETATSEEVATSEETNEERKPKRFALLVPQSTYGQTIIQAVSEVIERHNGLIVRTVTYLSEADNIQSAVRKVVNISLEELRERHNRERILQQQDTLASIIEQIETIEEIEEIHENEIVEGVSGFASKNDDLRPLVADFDVLILADSALWRLDIIFDILQEFGIDRDSYLVSGTSLWERMNTRIIPDLIGGLFAAPPLDRWQSFNESFRRFYGYLPPRQATMIYDAVHLVSRFADISGIRDQIDLAELTQLEIPGLDGILSLKPQGIIERELVIYEILADGLRIIDPPAPDTEEITEDIL